MPDRPLQATNSQLETRVKALEAWRVAIAIDAYKTTTNAAIAALAARVTKLEAGGTGGGATSAEVAALAAAVTTLQNKECVQLNTADPTTFESRLRVLENDHIPTP